MKKRTFKGLWAIIQILLFLAPIALLVWYVPYEISHDQHMVDTVNERALNYEPANGTITDFTQAEVMDNDAQLEYEERVWMLEHQELYYLYAILIGATIGGMLQMANLLWLMVYEEKTGYGGEWRG